MKICFIGALDVIHLRRLMNHMANQGHDVHVISYTTHAKQDVGHANIKVHKIEPKYNIFSKHLPKKAHYIKTMQVRKIVKEIKPDIIHGHFLTDYGLYTIFGGNARKIIHLTGSDVYLNWKTSRLQKIFDQYVLKKVDVIISPSNHTASKLMDYFDVDPSKVVIFPEGIDPNIFNLDVKPCLIDTNNYTVISTRRHYPVYNIKLLIESIPYVLEEVQNVKFIILGDGPENEKLRDLSAKIGVKDNIMFVGSVDHHDIPKWLTSSNIYVSTTLSDSLGLSNLEAMACGVFPIVTDIPAVREYILDGENGYIIPFDEPRVLANKIINALRDPGFLASARDKNLDLINSRFTYDKNVKVVEETYLLLAK
jgi:glycosyltransferase involved in cell wall biosynthesis